MSFTLVRTVHPNLADVRLNYKQIADEFCKYYYTLYDANMALLSTLYYPESQFTYQDSEFNGFDNLLNGLRMNGIYKFTHHSLNITTQPFGPANIIINIIGILSINDSIYQNKFIETIVLQRDDFNMLRIFSTIFKIIE